MWVYLTEEQWQLMEAMLRDDNSQPATEIADRIKWYRDNANDQALKGFRDAANRQISDEDDVEEGAIVSVGTEDPGAYVMAWLWIANVDAGIPESCECDNTHKHNDTVCRYCYHYGRRHWNDPAVATPK